MKKVLKRIFLILLAIVLLAQIPFVYRRYQNGQLSKRISSEREAASNLAKRPDPDFNDYRGVIHVHTWVGGHSRGDYDEVINAANATDLDFVLTTEHGSHAFDTTAVSLDGVFGKTLFVSGNEICTTDLDRFLVIPGISDAAGVCYLPTAAVLEKLHSENRLAIIAYPEAFNTWDSNFDGDEIFSLNTTSKKANPLLALFDLIWSYPTYPDLTIATHLTRPDESMTQYDEITAKRKVLLVARACAHSNLGFHLFGDDAGHKLVNIKLDPYETIFRVLQMHVLIERSKSLTKQDLVEAVKNGHFFSSFDVIGESRGFNFTAQQGVERRTMGDEMTLNEGLKLNAVSPLPARFVVLKNGEKFYESSKTTEINVDVTARSAYRVEVYRDDLGSPFDKMPWIMSNPIYVR